MNNALPPVDGPKKGANPARDAWRPEDKAEEAALDNPGEFSGPATEDSQGPVPIDASRTHGEVRERGSTGP